MGQPCGFQVLRGGAYARVTVAWLRLPLQAFGRHRASTPSVATGCRLQITTACLDVPVIPPRDGGCRPAAGARGPTPASAGRIRRLSLIRHLSEAQLIAIPQSADFRGKARASRPCDLALRVAALGLPPVGDRLRVPTVLQPAVALPARQARGLAVGSRAWPRAVTSLVCRPLFFSSVPTKCCMEHPSIQRKAAARGKMAPRPVAARARVRDDRPAPIGECAVAPRGLRGAPRPSID
jgi:hypothetical protein